MKKEINNLFLIFLPVIIIGIYYGITSVPVCVVLLVLRMMTSTRDTSGFFLLLFGGTLGGVVRNLYPSIPLYGVMLEFLGLCLIYKDLKKILMGRIVGFKYLILILTVFAVTYIYGPHTDYADSKILGIIKGGLILFMAYCVFDRSKKIQEEHLVQLLIISSVLLILFVSSFYHFNIGDIFDYNWFRADCESWSYINKEHMLGGYQVIGMNAAYACVMYLSMTKIDKEKACYYVMLSAQIILTSGCRQALLAIILVVFIRLFYFSNNKRKHKNIFWPKVFACLFILITFYLLKNSDIGKLSKTVEEGDVGRFAIYIDSILIFLSHPILGVGLGGYPVYSSNIEAVWPHNMILEILCETGLFGLCSILLILYLFFHRYHISLRYVTVSGCYLFLFLIALLVRVMVSGDFTESIELFSALFACNPSINKRNDKLLRNYTIQG